MRFKVFLSTAAGEEPAMKQIILFGILLGMSIHPVIIANDLPPVAVQQVSSPGRSYFYSGETIAVYENGSRKFVNLLNPSGEALGSWDGSQRRYFLKDHLGSVRTTVDQNGNVDGYDDYYPFGLTMPGRSSNTGNPNDNYKFTGYEQDDEAGLNLYHANARGYDPLIGRFLQIDPLFDDANQVGLSPYNYAWNNPSNLNDPTGECPWCVGAIVGAVTDYAVQVTVNLAEGKSVGDALTDVDGGSILVSAGAGALSGGLSVLSKAGKVSKLTKLATSEGGELIVDGAASVAGQLADDGEVSLTGVAADVTIGKVLSNKVDQVVESRFLKSQTGKSLVRGVDRADRIAANSTRRGRQTQATNKRAALARRVANRTTAASVSSTGAASAVVKEATKKEDEKNN